MAARLTPDQKVGSSNLSAVSFWQLAQRRACKQMGRHATDTVTLDITCFAVGRSGGRSGGRSVGRSVGLVVAVVVGANVFFCFWFLALAPRSGRNRENISV